MLQWPHVSAVPFTSIRRGNNNDTKTLHSTSTTHDFIPTGCSLSLFFPVPHVSFQTRPSPCLRFFPPLFCSQAKISTRARVEIDDQRHESRQMASGWSPTLPISGFDRQPPGRGWMPVFPRFLSSLFLSHVVHSRYILCVVFYSSGDHRLSECPARPTHPGTGYDMTTLHSAHPKW